MDIVPQLIANSIITSATYALVALGFTLIYGTTKFFNMAHGAVAAVGAYTVLAISSIRPVGPIGLIGAVVIGVLAAAFLGYALEKIIYAPLRRRHASGMVLLVASIGAFTVIQALLAIFFTSQFQILAAHDTNSTVFEIMGAVITKTQGIIIISAVVITAFISWALKKTLFGKAVRAINDDEEVARVVGINTEKIIGKVFFMGSAIAGLAGILIGFDTGLEPTMGMNMLLKGIVGSIVGGMGSIQGAVLGSFVLGFAENFGIWKISGEWKDAIAFGLLIIFLLWKPKGIIQK